MAQLQSTCVIGTLAISASHANAQQAIMIGGASNNAEFTNQCNLIAIGENTALSGSGALNPSSLTITQEGSGFNVNYSYYALNEGNQKPVVLTGGGALLKNLDFVLRKATNLPVFVAESSLSCVVNGTGKVLENHDKYKHVLFRQE